MVWLTSAGEMLLWLMFAFLCVGISAQCARRTSAVVCPHWHRSTMSGPMRTDLDFSVLFLRTQNFCRRPPALASFGVVRSGAHGPGLQRAFPAQAELLPPCAEQPRFVPSARYQFSWSDRFFCCCGNANWNKLDSDFSYRESRICLRTIVGSTQLVTQSPTGPLTPSRREWAPCRQRFAGSESIGAL